MFSAVAQMGIQGWIQEDAHYASLSFRQNFMLPNTPYRHYKNVKGFVPDIDRLG